MRGWKGMTLGADSHLVDSCSPGHRHNQTRAFTPHLESTTPFYTDVDPRRHKQAQFVPHHGPTNSWKLPTNEVTHLGPTDSWKLITAMDKRIYAPFHYLHNPLQTDGQLEAHHSQTKAAPHQEPSSYSTTYHLYTLSWT